MMSRCCWGSVEKKNHFSLGNERVKLLAYPFSHYSCFCMWQIDNVSLEGSEERNLCLYDECYDCDVVYKQPIYIISFSPTWLWGTTRRKTNRIFKKKSSQLLDFYSFFPRTSLNVYLINYSSLPSYLQAISINKFSFNFLYLNCGKFY